ncbi:hypothetical protein ElyMa_002985900 [Elysia marginata]|uniref:Uncharacterized protein n=1 Tax=Elysia marginata TaxID=1093978 RepID=A0AAV4ICV2_9GAST|nr:hypothetical protein ElyMa_002985900 [Elysia marginata]
MPQTGSHGNRPGGISFATYTGWRSYLDGRNRGGKKRSNSGVRGNGRLSTRDKSNNRQVGGQFHSKSKPKNCAADGLEQCAATSKPSHSPEESDSLASCASLASVRSLPVGGVGRAVLTRNSHDLCMLKSFTDTTDCGYIDATIKPYLYGRLGCGRGRIPTASGYTSSNSLSSIAQSILGGSTSSIGAINNSISCTNTDDNSQKTVTKIFGVGLCENYTGNDMVRSHSNNNNNINNNNDNTNSSYNNNNSCNGSYSKCGLQDHENINCNVKNVCEMVFIDRTNDGLERPIVEILGRVNGCSITDKLKVECSSKKEHRFKVYNGYYRGETVNKHHMTSLCHAENFADCYPDTFERRKNSDFGTGEEFKKTELLKYSRRNTRDLHNNGMWTACSYSPQKVWNKLSCRGCVRPCLKSNNTSTLWCNENSRVHLTGRTNSLVYHNSNNNSSSRSSCYSSRSSCSSPAASACIFEQSLSSSVTTDSSEEGAQLSLYSSHLEANSQTPSFTASLTSESCYTSSSSLTDSMCPTCASQSVLSTSEKLSENSSTSFSHGSAGNTSNSHLQNKLVAKLLMPFSICSDLEERGEEEGSSVDALEHKKKQPLPEGPTSPTGEKVCTPQDLVNSRRESSCIKRGNVQSSLLQITARPEIANRTAPPQNKKTTKHNQNVPEMPNNVIAANKTSSKKAAERFSKNYNTRFAPPFKPRLSATLPESKLTTPVVISNSKSKEQAPIVRAANVITPIQAMCDSALMKGPSTSSLVKAMRASSPTQLLEVTTFPQTSNAIPSPLKRPRSTTPTQSVRYSSPTKTRLAPPSDMGKNSSITNDCREIAPNNSHPNKHAFYQKQSLAPTNDETIGDDHPNVPTRDHIDTSSKPASPRLDSPRMYSLLCQKRAAEYKANLRLKATQSTKNNIEKPIGIQHSVPPNFVTVNGCGKLMGLKSSTLDTSRHDYVQDGITPSGFEEPKREGLTSNDATNEVKFPISECEPEAYKLPPSPHEKPRNSSHDLLVSDDNVAEYRHAQRNLTPIKQSSKEEVIPAQEGSKEQSTLLQHLPDPKQASLTEPALPEGTSDPENKTERWVLEHMRLSQMTQGKANLSKRSKNRRAQTRPPSRVRCAHSHGSRQFRSPAENFRSRSVSTNSRVTPDLREGQLNHGSSNGKPKEGNSHRPSSMMNKDTTEHIAAPAVEVIYNAPKTLRSLSGSATNFRISPALTTKATLNCLHSITPTKNLNKSLVRALKMVTKDDEKRGARTDVLKTRQTSATSTSDPSNGGAVRVIANVAKIRRSSVKDKKEGEEQCEKENVAFAITRVDQPLISDAKQVSKDLLRNEQHQQGCRHRSRRLPVARKRSFSSSRCQSLDKKANSNDLLPSKEDIVETRALISSFQTNDRFPRHPSHHNGQQTNVQLKNPLDSQHIKVDHQDLNSCKNSTLLTGADGREARSDLKSLYQASAILDSSWPPMRALKVDPVEDTTFFWRKNERAVARLKGSARRGQSLDHKTRRPGLGDHSRFEKVQISATRSIPDLTDERSMENTKHRCSVIRQYIQDKYACLRHASVPCRRTAPLVDHKKKVSDLLLSYHQINMLTNNFNGDEQGASNGEEKSKSPELKTGISNEAHLSLSSTLLEEVSLNRGNTISDNTSENVTKEKLVDKASRSKSFFKSPANKVTQESILHRSSNTVRPQRVPPILSISAYDSLITELKTHYLLERLESRHCGDISTAVEEDEDSNGDWDDYDRGVDDKTFTIPTEFSKGANGTEIKELMVTKMDSQCSVQNVASFEHDLTKYDESGKTRSVLPSGGECSERETEMPDGKGLGAACKNQETDCAEEVRGCKNVITQSEASNGLEKRPNIQSGLVTRRVLEIGQEYVHNNDLSSKLNKENESPTLEEVYPVGVHKQPSNNFLKRAKTEILRESSCQEQPNDGLKEVPQSDALLLFKKLNHLNQMKQKLNLAGITSYSGNEVPKKKLVTQDLQNHSHNKVFTHHKDKECTKVPHLQRGQSVDSFQISINQAKRFCSKETIDTALFADKPKTDGHSYSGLTEHTVSSGTVQSKLELPPVALVNSKATSTPGIMTTPLLSENKLNQDPTCLPHLTTKDVLTHKPCALIDAKAGLFSQTHVHHANENSKDVKSVFSCSVIEADETLKSLSKIKESEPFPSEASLNMDFSQASREETKLVGPKVASDAEVRQNLLPSVVDIDTSLAINGIQDFTILEYVRDLKVNNGNEQFPDMPKYPSTIFCSNHKTRDPVENLCFVHCQEHYYVEPQTEPLDLSVKANTPVKPSLQPEIPRHVLGKLSDQYLNDFHDGPEDQAGVLKEPLDLSKAMPKECHKNINELISDLGAGEESLNKDGKAQHHLLGEYAVKHQIENGHEEGENMIDESNQRPSNSTVCKSRIHEGIPKWNALREISFSFNLNNDKSKCTHRLEVFTCINLANLYWQWMSWKMCESVMYNKFSFTNSDYDMFREIALNFAADHSKSSDESSFRMVEIDSQSVPDTGKKWERVVEKSVAETSDDNISPLIQRRKCIDNVEELKISPSQYTNRKYQLHPLQNNDHTRVSSTTLFSAAFHQRSVEENIFQLKRIGKMKPTICSSLPYSVCTGSRSNWEVTKSLEDSSDFACISDWPGEGSSLCDQTESKATLLSSSVSSLHIAVEGCALDDQAREPCSAVARASHMSIESDSSFHSCCSVSNFSSSKT